MARLTIKRSTAKLASLYEKISAIFGLSMMYSIKSSLAEDTNKSTLAEYSQILNSTYASDICCTTLITLDKAVVHKYSSSPNFFFSILMLIEFKNIMIRT